MKNFLKSLFVAASLLAGGATVTAAEPGKDYSVLNPTLPVSGKKIEVLEFFSYGCPHCYDLHKPLSAWEKTMPKDVELIYVPTIFSDPMEPLARTLYALESLGLAHKLHDALYRAIHVDGADLYDENSISDFVARKGVDRAKFSAAYKSFSIQSRVTRARQMIRTYGVRGTPTIVVDGKYVITGLYPEDAIRVMNEVIVMARKERPGKKK